MHIYIYIYIYTFKSFTAQATPKTAREKDTRHPSGAGTRLAGAAMRALAPVGAGRVAAVAPCTKPGPRSLGRRDLSNPTCLSIVCCFALLDLCVSSLRRGHANLLCIVPILTDDPRRESIVLFVCR